MKMRIFSKVDTLNLNMELKNLTETRGSLNVQVQLPTSNFQVQLPPSSKSSQGKVEKIKAVRLESGPKKSQGLSLNRSQIYSALRTYNTPTESQVVYK